MEQTPATSGAPRKGARTARRTKREAGMPQQAGEEDLSRNFRDDVNALNDPTDATELTNVIDGAGTGTVNTSITDPDVPGESTSSGEALHSETPPEALTSSGGEHQPPSENEEGERERQAATQQDAGAEISSEPVLDAAGLSQSNNASVHQREDAPAGSQEAAPEVPEAGDATSGASTDGAVIPSLTTCPPAGDVGLDDVKQEANADAEKVSDEVEAVPTAPPSNVQGDPVGDGRPEDEKVAPAAVDGPASSPTGSKPEGEGPAQSEEALPPPPPPKEDPVVISTGEPAADGGTISTTSLLNADDTAWDFDG
ncbi:hypothetical protein OH77DRAFT_1429072 [Trametes cingulata]|nr:hypothetical protein OH77DRAFT_1429072 [Trametes cingulata]